MFKVNFNIVNYPYPVASNIPEKPAYGVYASRIICFARACDHFTDFSDRHNQLCTTLLRQGYKYALLLKHLSSTYTKYKTLFEKYLKSLNEIREDIPLPMNVNNVRSVTIRS